MSIHTLLLLLLWTMNVCFFFPSRKGVGENQYIVRWIQYSYFTEDHRWGKREGWWTFQSLVYYPTFLYGQRYENKDDDFLVWTLLIGLLHSLIIIFTEHKKNMLCINICSFKICHQVSREKKSMPTSTSQALCTECDKDNVESCVGEQISEAKIIFQDDEPWNKEELSDLLLERGLFLIVTSIQWDILQRK